MWVPSLGREDPLEEGMAPSNHQAFLPSPVTPKSSKPVQGTGKQEVFQLALQKFSHLPPVLSAQDLHGTSLKA